VGVRECGGVVFDGWHGNLLPGPRSIGRTRGRLIRGIAASATNILDAFHVFGGE